MRGRMGGMDENPYKPPQEQEPLTTGKVAKRGLGVGAIILLTPVAVAIAFGATCAAAYAVSPLVVAMPAAAQVITSAVIVLFVVLPGMVLTAMIRWAMRTHRRGRELKPDESPQPQRPKSLWGHLIAFPSVGSVALMILFTVVISALVFTWLAYNMTVFQPPSP